MILVLGLALGLWGLGFVMRVPKLVRFQVIAVLFGAVLLIQFIFPSGHMLREATGGTPQIWVLLIGILSVGIGYGHLLKWLRARAQMRAVDDDAPPETFREAELSRYARHMILREIGGPGQKRLKLAKVLVIGAGGLGSPACLYLAAAGVGTIGVIDDDSVENTNLQRQIIHADADIGTPKVFSAQAAMQAQNPYIEVLPYNRRLTPDIAETLIKEFDLVLDGTDNFETRYLVNEICVRTGVPLIAAALTQWEGQISSYDPNEGAPCYACIFPTAPDPELAPSCAEAGVAGPLPGVVGSMMALEAVKLITGAGQDLRGRMMIYDGLFGESRMMTLKRRADCLVCGAQSDMKEETT